MRLSNSLCVSLIALSSGASAASETRDLDAHVHGHGALNIAIDGDQVAMELEAPGFDIVGFEHEATTDADKATIEAALASLSDPAKLFALPAAAGCSVTEVEAELHSEAEEEHHDDHDKHDHEDHEDHDEHDHEDHDEHDHEKHGDKEHDHEDHDEAHDDHKDEHDEHHDEHEGGETHSEFHAMILMTCSDVSKIEKIGLPYFNTFENAEELEVQVVTDAGSGLLEATREAPELDLSQLN